MPRSSHSKETATASKTETSAASQPSRPTTNETKLVNFRLPTADQFSVAVDTDDSTARRRAHGLSGAPQALSLSPIAAMCGCRITSPTGSWDRPSQWPHVVTGYV